MYYQGLDAKYKTMRRFLPALSARLQFGANAAGEPFIAAFTWFLTNRAVKRPDNHASHAIISKWEVKLKSCLTVHFAPRKRSALKMTEAELRLIAKAAIIGDSSQPVNG